LSDEFGINETKLSYTCERCGEFKLLSRRIGDEHVHKTRRTYCYRCDDLTTFELDMELYPTKEGKNAIPMQDVQS